jgi:hypothetical protein
MNDLIVEKKNKCKKSAWHTAIKPSEKNISFIYLFIVIAQANVTYVSQGIIFVKKTFFGLI